MKTTAEKIAELVADELSVDIGIVTPSARLVEDLGADSLDVIELIMCFEIEFKIEIPDEDYEKIVTVSDAVAYIGKQESQG